MLAHLIAGEDRAECDKVRHGLGVGAAADALQLSLLAGLLLIYLGQSADEFAFGRHVNGRRVRHFGFDKAAEREAARIFSEARL